MLRPSTLIPCVLVIAWLASPVDASDRPGTFVARSFAPAVTEAEAIELARRDAVDSLVPRLRDVVELRVRERKLRSAALVSLPSEQTLRAVLRAELAGDSMIRSREVRREPKSYGDVYSASLVVDVNPRALDRLAEKAMSVSRGAARRSMIATVGTGVLLGGIVVIYLAANSLTRGYYQWRLRLLAAVAAAVSVGAGTVLGYGIGA